MSTKKKTTTTRKRKPGRGVVSDFVNKVKSFFFFAPNKLDRTSYNTFEKNKAKKIVGITVRRAPIFSAVDKVLNFISLGKFAEGKRNAGYDKMFHLSAVLDMEDGTKIIIQKNERINLTENFKNEEGTEYRTTPYEGELSLSELMEKTEKLMGTFKFYQYNALENNCQDFISAVLKAAGAADADTLKFVKQDMTEILKAMPKYVGKVSQFVTDLGGKFNQLMGGRGRQRRRTAIKKTVKKTTTKKKNTVKKVTKKR
ncbi:MAG: hypothetical protein ACP5N7_05340 [Candidatus Pacearchaeota archaeon]